MFERFTDEARALVGGLPRQARTFGHGYIAPEHLLLALVATTTPAGAALRDGGVTPERVEREIFRRIGHGHRPVSEGLFSDLDKDALAAIGIDLDTVRTAIESRFGAEALVRADIAARSRRRPPLRRLRRLLRRRRRGIVSPRVPAVGSVVPVPFTLRTKRLLQQALRESMSRHEGFVGVEHIALALVNLKGGLAPEILFTLGGPAPLLRTAILDRYRKAG